MEGCRLPKVPVAAGRDYADSGEFAEGSKLPSFEYMGTPVWTTQSEWSASAPFVDHYVLRRKDGGPVVVDEINWWPLVFPLKCRDILTGEARLAGPNKFLLELCSQPQKNPANTGRFYAWIDPAEAKALESMRPKGALINRRLKNNLLDWGFSDAVMAVGPMQDLFREGMRQLFVKSARFHADAPASDDWEQRAKDVQRIDREFIVVSHSLGSYLVFSTLNLDLPEVLPANASAQSNSEEAAAREDAAARYILERTSLVYFFANQVPLLELASMDLSNRMKRWKNLRQAAEKPQQVIAWSDPSDLLSWRVPGIDGLIVDNLYVRNTWWHWIIANPASAHGNYDRNKNVLGIMMPSNAADSMAKVGK